MTDAVHPALTPDTKARFETRSGLAIDVRMASEADEPALADLFAKVSKDDLRFRFFSASDHVSHEQLGALVHANHFTSESFLAFDAQKGDLVASAMLACDSKLDTAEVAVSIRSDYKGLGVGWALLGFLAQEAERLGVRRVIAIEARENHAAIEVERDKGFVPEPFEGDATLVILSKEFR